MWLCFVCSCVRVATQIIVAARRCIFGLRAAVERHFDIMRTDIVVALGEMTSTL